MSDLISERSPKHRYRKPKNILILESKQNTFGQKSIRTLAQTIWNTLFAKIRAVTKFDEFKTTIGNINVAWCSC